MATPLTLDAPERFSFRRTVLSHGWCSLPPFRLERPAGEGVARRGRWRLHRVLDLGGAAHDGARGPVVTATISEGPRGTVRLDLPAGLSPEQRAEAARQVRIMLRLDEDLSPFYAAAARRDGYGWIAASGAGRLLRAPTVYEDLVKMICTTNCSWALTDRMVRAIVGRLGRRPTEPGRAGGRAGTNRRRAPAGGSRGLTVPGGKGFMLAEDGAPAAPRSFPSPRAMARAGEAFYRDEARSGYRAAYLQELAERVASGEIDPESWARGGRPAGEVRKRIESVKGAGRYAAENLLRLLGRHDGLALDSWCRKKFSRMHARGRTVSDRRIAAHYREFGEWRGLAMWCDLTRDWLDDAATADGAARAGREAS